MRKFFQLLILGIKYSKLRLFLGIFGGIWGILGYFVDFFSGILVFHYPPWPTLITPWLRLTQSLTICQMSDIDSLIDDAIPENTKKGTGKGISVLKGKAANFKFFIQAS